MSRVTSDVDAARVFTGQGVLQIVNTVVLYVTVLALMFFLNWQLALLSLLTLPFLAVTAVPVRHPGAAPVQPDAAPVGAS